MPTRPAQEDPLPSAIRQPSYAVPDLRKRDDGGAKLMPVLFRIQAATRGAGSARMSSETTVVSRMITM